MMRRGNKMKRNTLTLLLGLALSMSLHAHAVHTGTVQPCTPSKPHEVHTLPGFITVHIECERVLLEIPTALFGKDMLMSTEFAALSTGSSEYAPGTSVANRVVRWLRRGNRVYADVPRFDAWARNAPSLQEGIQEAALPIVLAAFDVVRESDTGAPIVDVTSMFTTGVPSGFALDFMRHYHMISVDPSRSYVQTVRAFPTNLEFGYYQTWTADRQELLKHAGDDEAPPAQVAFAFRTNLLLLPEQPMAGRCEDTRVGFFSVPFLDYGTDEHRGVSRAFITRYRLEKKDPQAAVSEPVKPIVFYLSPEIPLKWRPYLKRAVEDWRGPLEKAGFKDAIFAKDAPTKDEDPDWDPGDLRYSVIRWTPGARENALGPNVVDPRSGEVISSHTLVWHDVLRLVEIWYFTQAAPLDPRARKLPLPDDLIGELLSYVVKHEVGHALGLRHNLKGHSSFSAEQLRNGEWTMKWGNSASVMDYSRFNYVAQPGDNAYLLPRIGPYDYFAIEWGYTPIPGAQGCDAEWSELDKKAALQVDDPMLRFGGENDAAEVDPTVNTQVLASDPIAGADFGLRNIDRVAPLLIPATTEKGKDYSQLAEVYQALVTKRWKQLQAVAKMVGGVEETRYHAGRGTIPFKPVTAARQRAAIAFIVERGFTRPDALLDPEVLWRIGPSDGSGMLQEMNERLLNQLIDPDVMHRMAQAARYPGMKESYQGIDMIQDLNNGLFAELKQPRPVIGLYRRDLQRKYVTILLSQLSADGDSAGEMQAAIRAGIAQLGAKLDQGAKKSRDPQTQWHLKNLKAALDRGS
jgi:hypothetical protein